MKKLNKVAALFATVALTSPLVALAQTPSGADQWKSANGIVWRNGTNELCWRNAGWTPATADAACDGALKPPPAPAPARHADSASQSVAYAARFAARKSCANRCSTPPAS